MPEQPTAKKIEKCRLTGAELAPVFDLGSPCVSDFLKPGEEGVKAPLCVAVAKEAPYLAQLTHSYPPEAMYRRYHYRSGTNEAMRAELADVVAKARRLRPVKAGEVVLDIASNDGELLKNWTETDKRLGIDPSDVAREAAAYGSETYHLVNDFFSAKAYWGFDPGAPASVVTCVAMFYDTDDPLAFLKDVRAVMADDGLFVLQVAYTPLMLQHGWFDNIGHEHLCYYDYRSLEYALHASGFSIEDAELTPSNGGSIRIYATPQENIARMASTAEGVVGFGRCDRIAAYEADTYGEVWDDWQWMADRAWEAKRDLLKFLYGAKDYGETVVGIGASTKANTLLQFCGIGPDLLPCIADRQPHKHGLVTAGSNIPIVSEEDARRMKPDYLLAFPWFFQRTLAEREKDLLAQGTKLVLPLPKLTVLD